MIKKSLLEQMLNVFDIEWILCGSRRSGSWSEGFLLFLFDRMAV